MNELRSSIPSLRIMPPLSDSLTTKSIQIRSGSPSARRKNMKWCWCITAPWNSKGVFEGWGIIYCICLEIPVPKAKRPQPLPLQSTPNKRDTSRVPGGASELLNLPPHLHSLSRSTLHFHHRQSRQVQHDLSIPRVTKDCIKKAFLLRMHHFLLFGLIENIHP
jgi:hypothetical protein